MRVSLWPGLVRAALENQRRQQDRIRLFEHGARFVVQAGQVSEVDSLAGIAAGRRLPEQWGSGESREPVDFFDVKADLQALLSAMGARGRIQLSRPGRFPACTRDAPRASCARERRWAALASCIRVW